MEFLINLMNPGTWECILDYGCGNGYLANKIDSLYKCVWIYDINYKYLEHPIPKHTQNRKYRHIYFMHSIAHIENIEEVLTGLKENLTDDGCIYVITPNKNWMDEFNDKSYEPDDTVIKHFTPTTLENLFFKCGYNIKLTGQIGTNIDDCNARIFLVATK